MAQSVDSDLHDTASAKVGALQIVGAIEVDELPVGLSYTWRKMAFNSSLVGHSILIVSTSVWWLGRRWKA